MKANKMVVAALSLALSLSMVACNKKKIHQQMVIKQQQNKILQILQIMQTMIM